MVANSTKPLGWCSPQNPPEPTPGCCAHAFPAPPCLLTLLACLPSFLLRCPHSTDKLYHYFFHGKVHLTASRTALAFTSERLRDLG